MSDLISRSLLFNRLANVQTLAEAYAVIQEMPTVEEETTMEKAIEDLAIKYQSDRQLKVKGEENV